MEIGMGELEDVSTSCNLNPQSFIGLRCRIHPEYFIQWICLENDRENKLFCSACWIRSKEKTEANSKADKQTGAASLPSSAAAPAAASNIIDYKTFLRNLYNFCTLEDGDPERFNSELVNCLEGCKQSEKLKMFMGNVGGIREEVLAGFKQQTNIVFEEMESKIKQVIKMAKSKFDEYLENQTDSLFSRDTLQIKQFKERGCKLVLSAVKTATLSDDPRAFEALTSAINRLHSGQVELSYARQHALKIFKGLISELKFKLMNQVQEALNNQLAQNLSDLQDQFHFLPKKNTSGALRSVNFSYLQQNRLLDIPETNKLSHLSPSNSANNLEAFNRKLFPNNSQPFIIKQLQQGSSSSQTRFTQQKTNSPGSDEKTKYQELIGAITSAPGKNSRSEDINSANQFGGKQQYPGASLFSTFSTTLRGSFSSGAHTRRLKQYSHQTNKRETDSLEQKQVEEAANNQSVGGHYIPNSFGTKSLVLPSSNASKGVSSSLNSIVLKPTADKISAKAANSSVSNIIRKTSLISFPAYDQPNQNVNLVNSQIHEQPETTTQQGGFTRAISSITQIQQLGISEKNDDDAISNSESSISKRKSITSIGAPTQGIGNKKLKEIPEGLLQEKSFKHNILALIRISNKLIKHKLLEMAEEKDMAPSDGNDDFGGLVMAERDGFLSVYCAQGSDIMQVYREKAHEKIISIAKGRTGHMFFTAGEQAQGLGQTSIKLWMVHANLKLSELVELKMVETNIQEIFFVREEFTASLSKLSFCVWTKNEEQQQTPSNGGHHIHNKSNEDSSAQNTANLRNTVEKINVWNLEFNTHKFENARMFSAASIDLPANILGVSVIDDELLGFTKNSLHQFKFFQEYQTLQKKASQKFINVLASDSLIGVRKYTNKATKSKQFFVFSESGLVYTLSDQIQILQEKSIRDQLLRPINLKNTIVFKRESDLSENSRFVYFFCRDSKVLYAFDFETQKTIDSVTQPEEIKGLFFYGVGKYLTFEQTSIKVWKDLPSKTELLYPQQKFVSFE